MPQARNWEQDFAHTPTTTRILGPGAGADDSYDAGRFLDECHAFAAEHADVLVPGSRVGILAENSILWLVAFHAAFRVGAVIVPLSAKLPASGIEFVVEDAELDALFCEDVRAPEIARLSLGRTRIRPLRVPATVARPERRPAASRDPNELGMILYTSGSTGRPKGVELANRTLRWILDPVAPAVAAPQRRMLVAAPLSHIAALMFALCCLSQGGTLVLLPAFEPRSFLEAIDRHAVTDLTGVPPMFSMLGAHRDLMSTLDMSSVARVTMGSAPASDELLEKIGRWFPEARVSLSYGTTESGPGVFGPHPGGLATPVQSVGCAQEVPEIRLVDGSGNLATRRGVLEVRSPSLMIGYRNRPDVVAPLTADGFHHTGDVFEVDEHGFFYFLGREDDMFSSGGENVYPQAVEEVLDTHPSVLTSVVVPVPDATKGHKPVAFVLLHPGERLDEDELKRHVLATLEPFAHPRRIWALDELPLATTNKVDRRALTALATQRLAAP